MSCYTPKKTDKNKYIGIEIEFYSKYSRGYIQNIFNRNKILTKFCKLGSDSSIESPYTIDSYDDDELDGFELRILSKVKNLNSNLLIVRNFLKMVSAEVNNSCGLHVHLDARHVDATKMLKNLTNNLDTIENSVPPRRLDNDFSNSIKDDYPKMLEMIDRYKAGKPNLIFGRCPYSGTSQYRPAILGYQANKYRSINIECMLRYKTIEVRCHEGTVNCAEIYKWCQYLCEVAYEGKMSTTNKNYIFRRVKTKGEYQAKRIAG